MTVDIIGAMNLIKRLLTVIFFFLLTACGGETATSASDHGRRSVQAVLPTSLPPTLTLPPPVLSEQVVAETAVSTIAAVIENEVVEEVETVAAVSPTAVPPTLTAEPEPTVSLVQSGRTEEGGYFLGNPDAPITFIDYSDFM